MEIKQIYNLTNAATKAALGETVVLKEDLSNLVDIGNAIFNANSLDKYVGKLVDNIGKIIFVNRVYIGSAPSVMMDGWEYGSVLEKVSAGLPEAEENESWNLVNNKSYDPHIFKAPKNVEVKFYNKYITFEIDMSFTETQLKSAFSSATQMNAFISMLYACVENSMTVKLDELIRRTINNMIGETIYDGIIKGGNDIDKSTSSKAINLLYMYNNKVTSEGGTAITADVAITDPEFIRYAAYIIKLTHDRMRSMSTVFNVGKQPRFTPSDLCHIVMLSDFANSADIYLQSDTFHNELTKLPTAELVPYWQGSGTDYTFDEVSKVHIDVQDPEDSYNKFEVEATGILAVMFDRWALGVSNVDRKVTSQWTPNAEFFTNFYKYKAGYFNDLNENFVVFYIA